MARHVQVNPHEHSHLRVKTERSAELGDNVMFSALFPHEFRQAQAYYPIILIKDGRLGGYRPIALFGLEEQENLFLANGQWDASYIPLAMQMKPFLIGQSANQDTMMVHLDVEHPRVSQIDGEVLFEADGSQSELLTRISSILFDVHHAEQGIAAFSALLEEFELIEPFTLDVTLNDGMQGRLAGYFSIAEEKLYSLSASALERLQSAGLLLPVFMMVASTSQFLGLIERKNKLIGACA